MVKPEVDVLAGHELTHLEHRHPTKLLFAFLAAILLPAWFSPAAYLLIGLVSPILIRLAIFSFDRSNHCSRSGSGSARLVELRLKTLSRVPVESLQRT